MTQPQTQTPSAAKPFGTRKIALLIAAFVVCAALFAASFLMGTQMAYNLSMDNGQSLAWHCQNLVDARDLAYWTLGSGAIGIIATPYWIHSAYARRNSDDTSATSDDMSYYGCFNDRPDFVVMSWIVLAASIVMCATSAGILTMIIPWISAC